MASLDLTKKYARNVMAKRLENIGRPNVGLRERPDGAYSTLRPVLGKANPILADIDWNKLSHLYGNPRSNQ